MSFVEIAERVYVLRYPVLDVNVTLVRGDGAALVVDTLSTIPQAEELCTAVRAVTRDPVTIVNTHHHFDHCYGNATLAGPDTAIWAHEEAVRELREHGGRAQRELYTTWLEHDPALAEGLAAVTIRVPDRPVHGRAELDIGGRAVLLHHLGRGHTAGDLVVQVPDAGIVLAGDLVEQGAPPDFADGYPLDWPDTVAALLRLVPGDGLVVPGHGATVGHEFVAAQHAELTELDWRIREGHADGAAPEKVAPGCPFGAEAALVAVKRGYAELSGRA